MKIDAGRLHYKELNQKIREAVRRGASHFELVGVNGHRYLADGLEGPLRLHIHGTPGQDLGAFMNGPALWVQGNAQDGAGNTMDAGRIVVEGMAGDLAGYGMRGGEIFIRGDAGYRVGIHMKSYRQKVPTIVIGGKAGDFLGEYMAGGCIVLLGLFSADHPARPICGNYLGTGMHGGVIYVRGTVEPFRLGKGLTATDPTAEDQTDLKRHVQTFADLFNLDCDEILSGAFTKIVPATHRPYGSMYAY